MIGLFETTDFLLDYTPFLDWWRDDAIDSSVKNRLAVLDDDIDAEIFCDGYHQNQKGALTNLGMAEAGIAQNECLCVISMSI